MGKAETILQLFKEDERRAFQLLYDTYYVSLSFLANSIVNDSEAAEDLVQECLINFWVNRRYEGLPHGLDKYIFQAVKFSSINYLKACQKRQQLNDTYTETLSPIDTLPDEEEVDQIEALYAAINLLPEERKKIFLMIVVKEMKYQDVADELNISKNTVKTQMVRSIRFLRERLNIDSFSAILVLLLKKK